MPKVTINRFDSGQAEDVRTTSDFFCEQSYNFDITTKPHSLIPKKDMEAETFSGGTASTTSGRGVNGGGGGGVANGVNTGGAGGRGEVRVFVL